MACDLTLPSLSLICEQKYCTTNSSCSTVCAAGVTGITAKSDPVVTLDPGASETINLSNPIQYLKLSTPQPVNVELNGSGAPQVVSRQMTIIGTVTTSIIITNDAVADPKKVQVQLTIAEGTGVT